MFLKTCLPFWLFYDLSKTFSQHTKQQKIQKMRKKIYNDKKGTKNPCHSLWIPTNFKQSPPIPRNPYQFQAIPTNSLETKRIPRNPYDFLGIPTNSDASLPIPRNLNEFLRNPMNSTESLPIPTKPNAFRGILPTLRNPNEFSWLRTNFNEFHS